MATTGNKKVLEILYHQDSEQPDEAVERELKLRGKNEQDFEVIICFPFGMVKGPIQKDVFS